MSSIFMDSKNEITEILRMSARKQLDSYADQWIMLFELLQNALDAVEDISREKKVSLIIDPGKNEITVSDNGTGFPTDMSFFALGKGSKSKLNNPSIRGEHGVGMKMVILCSELFEIWTIDAGKVWKATFRDGFKFLSKEETECVENDAKDSIIPQGFTTTIRVRFPRGQSDTLREIEARKILNIIFEPYEKSQPHSHFSKRRKCDLFVEHYFRTSSYTGDVNRMFDGKKPANLEVSILKDSSIQDSDLPNAYPDFLIEYWTNPKTIVFPACYWDPSEWYDKPERKGILSKNNIRSFNPSNKSPNHMWVIKTNDKNDIRALMDNPNINDIYEPGYFDDLIENSIRGVFIVIASASSASDYPINNVMITHPDQVIAADGVITTNQIRTPKRGKNQNYLNNIHFVVNLNDRVNYGKQGVKNPYLLSKLYAFFEEIYIKKLVDMATTVAGKNSENSGPPSKPILDVIGLDDLDEPEISIKKIPAMENTLIALTHELIAKGRITGIKSYQLSSREQYDCKGIINVINKTEFVPERDSDLANIEYKISIMELINDIELGIKVMSEMHLVIVWDDVIASSVTNYQYLDLDRSNYENVRITSVDKVIKSISTGDQIPVLTIKDLVRVKKIG